MGGEQSVPVVNRTSLYHDEKKKSRLYWHNI